MVRQAWVNGSSVIAAPRRERRGRTMNRIHAAVFTVLLAVAWSAGAVAQKLPGKTKEGLELVSSEGSVAVYVRPGTDLGDYQNVHFLKAYVAFQKDWVRDYNRTALRSHRLTDADLEQIKSRITDGFDESFRNEFSKAGYTEAGRSGENVLILRPAILDVTMESPRSVTDNSGSNVVDYGKGTQMSLVLELYDAGSSELLARIFNRDSDNGGSSFTVDSGSMNRTVESRIFRSWADSILSILGD